MILEVILFLVFILAYLFWRDNYSATNPPPGPLRLPILGNLHQIVATGQKQPHQAFDVLSRTWGPIYRIKMGTKEAIVVTSFQDMSALLTRDECGGRVLEEFLQDRSFKQELGIIFSNGEEWRTIRRFTMKTLRDFGFGKKSSLESVLQEELQLFLDQLQSRITTSPILTVSLFFNLSLLNVLWSMVAGSRFSYTDPRLNHLLQLNSDIFKAGNFGSELSISFPFLRHLFPEATKANRFKAGFDGLHAFLREIIDEHRSRDTTNSECFVDVFLQKIDSSRNSSLPEDVFFSDDQLVVVLLDLFMTGSDTLNGALSYGILFMILHPQVQDRVRAEINEVVGSGASVLFEHRAKMIYTQATLMEVLRLGNIVPIIPPRKVTQTFVYKGYNFPKGMTIMPNLYSVFTNPNYFEKPEEFRPERFINAAGQLTNTEMFAPFGFGKRFCMGETQASSAMFLYFTTLIKNLQFSKVPGQPDPTTEPVTAFTLTPQPFEVVLKIL